MGLPLELTFKSMPHEGAFPEEWKKCNVVPNHKKESKHLMINYCPVS